MMIQDRVIFFSINDGASYHNLQKIEHLFSKIGIHELREINDLLELNHAKQYLDNDMFLYEWNEESKTNFIKMTEDRLQESRKYFLAINDNSLLNDIGTIDYNYRKSFWSLLQYFEGYKKLTARGFTDAIKLHPHHLYYILQNKKLVAHFNSEVRQLILSNTENAELLLRAMEEKSGSKSEEIHFPASLSLSDKENMIVDYLNGDDPNLNYVDLIQNVKDSQQIKLSAKTRLLAKNWKNQTY